MSCWLSLVTHNLPQFMRINQLSNFTLLMTLLGIPVGGLLMPESAIAQQRSNVNFQNINFSSAVMRTVGTETTITIFVQNYGANGRSFNYAENLALSQIKAVDAQNNTYHTNISSNLNKSFFYGENRSTQLTIHHPMGINLRYLQLDSGDYKKPIYIRL